MKSQQSYLSNITGALLVVAFIFVLAWKSPSATKSIVWKLDRTDSIAQYKTTIWANPVATKDAGRKTISFNGIDDGIVIDTIPIAGYQQFTIEILFKPDPSGPKEPRIIHFEDVHGNRGTFELRITKEGQWYMDTFLKNADAQVKNNRLTLIDSSLLHDSNKWYWVAMTYDGKEMRSYVNGQKELQGALNMSVFSKGRLAFGTRLNKVNYFKGFIAEIRFHDQALDPSSLQRITY